MDSQLYNIDFNKLPNLDTSKFIMDLDDKIKMNLSKLPLTYERAISATKLCWFISGDHKILCCGEENTMKMKEAFLRSSLTEFVSMEDMLKRDLLDLNIISTSSTQLKLNKTSDPLLHIMREIRNFVLHLHSNKLKIYSKYAYYRSPNEPESTEKIEVDILTIPEIKIEEFQKLRNSQYYKTTDIESIIEWFNMAQNVWGIDDLLFKAIEKYSLEIIQYYDLKSIPSN